MKKGRPLQVYGLHLARVEMQGGLGECRGSGSAEGQVRKTDTNRAVRLDAEIASDDRIPAILVSAKEAEVSQDT